MFNRQNKDELMQKKLRITLKVVNLWNNLEIEKSLCNTLNIVLKYIGYIKYKINIKGCNAIYEYDMCICAFFFFLKGNRQNLINVTKIGEISFSLYSFGQCIFVF